MFELQKSFRFEAGHCLAFHDGKCIQPHGHSYILVVHLLSHELLQEGPQKNMVMDFADITAVVKPMIDKYFDHQWLNESLKTETPTVEFMAKWIYQYLEPHIPKLNAITIHETATASVTYRPK